MTVAFDKTSTLTGTDDGDGNANLNFRQVIKAAALSAATGTQCQLELRWGTSCPTETGSITSAYFGQGAGAGSTAFTGDQVQVLFSGGATVNGSAAGVVTSDVFTLAQSFDNTKDYVLAFHIKSGSTSSVSFASVANCDQHFNATPGADTSSQTNPAMGTVNSGSLGLLEKITITVSGGVSVNVTGVSSTSAAGTITVSGKANVNVTGAASTSAAGTPTVSGKANVNVTGVASTSAAGTPTVTGAANVNVTGVSSTSAAGTPAVTGLANVNLTGAAATGSAGDVTVSVGGAVNVNVTGVSATGSAGTPTVTGLANVNVTGVQSASAAGSPTVTAAANANVTGVEAASSVGSLTETGFANVPLTGVSAAGQAGDVTVSVPTSVSVTLDGVVAFGQVGQIVAQVPFTGTVGGSFGKPYPDRGKRRYWRPEDVYTPEQLQAEIAAIEIHLERARLAKQRAQRQEAAKQAALKLEEIAQSELVAEAIEDVAPEVTARKPDTKAISRVVESLKASIKQAQEFDFDEDDEEVLLLAMQ